VADEAEGEFDKETGENGINSELIDVILS